MPNPRVSILMPVYNVAPYLREAVDSILSQTYTDFELIVLDDGSTDGSSQILEIYTDPRIIRYRGERNVGLANILNVGLQMARGEFIARMDSDDLSLPTRLSVQVAYLDAHSEVDLCSCGMELFGAKQAIWSYATDVDTVKINALFHSPILHASSVWRRTAFADRGLTFDQQMVPAEDYDLWVRALLQSCVLVNIPDVLYRYRIHMSQTTAMDQRSADRCRQIRQHYIRSLFPTMEDSLTAAFLEIPPQACSYSQWLLLTRFVQQVLKQNRCLSPRALRHVLYGYLWSIARANYIAQPTGIQRLQMYIRGMYYRIVKYI